MDQNVTQDHLYANVYGMVWYCLNVNGCCVVLGMMCGWVLCHV